MNLLDVTVSYLEMRSPTSRNVTPPCDRLQVIHVETPSVAFYRFLYDSVGKEYHWLSRRKMPDGELAALLSDPGSEVHVLHVAGLPAGFAELDARQPSDIELVQFGLLPDHIGRGLGSWFLQQIIDHVWQRQPQRFWLHTCTLDHPAALPMYSKAGFVQFKVEQIRREP